MANLTIDIGNTRTKLGVFEGQNLLETLVVEQLDLSSLKTWSTNHSIQKVIYSTVVGIEPILKTYLEQYFFCIALTESTPLPFENKYETPSTLGKDRLAAVAGAQTWSEGQTCLIIDAGTCITYDYLQMGRVYLGGNIAPGLAMRMKAMHHFTKALPLVEIVSIEKKIGSS
ncbi:MAG: type III pantothenate kinase, partial [Saprospiraceae bacterium]|nr:type III pantothenate kinase [Saprospiraceae bacterium]